MKLSKNVEIRSCDYCHYRKEHDKDSVIYGGSSFDGWIELEFINHNTYITNIHKIKRFDFCTIGCLKGFIKDNYGE